MSEDANENPWDKFYKRKMSEDENEKIPQLLRIVEKLLSKSGYFFTIGIIITLIFVLVYGSELPISSGGDGGYTLEGFIMHENPIGLIGLILMIGGFLGVFLRAFLSILHRRGQSTNSNEPETKFQ